MVGLLLPNLNQAHPLSTPNTTYRTLNNLYHPIPPLRGKATSYNVLPLQSLHFPYLNIPASSNRHLPRPCLPGATAGQTIITKSMNIVMINPTRPKTITFFPRFTDFFTELQSLFARFQKKSRVFHIFHPPFYLPRSLPPLHHRQLTNPLIR